MSDVDEMLTVAEAARRLRIDPKQVRRYADRLAGQDRTPPGHVPLRVSLPAVEKLRRDGAAGRDIGQDRIGTQDRTSVGTGQDASSLPAIIYRQRIADLEAMNADLRADKERLYGLLETAQSNLAREQTLRALSAPTSTPAHEAHRDTFTVNYTAGVLAGLTLLGMTGIGALLRPPLARTLAATAHVASAYPLLVIGNIGSQVVGYGLAAAGLFVLFRVRRDGGKNFGLAFLLDGIGSAAFAAYDTYLLWLLRHQHIRVPPSAYGHIHGAVEFGWITTAVALLLAVIAYALRDTPEAAKSAPGSPHGDGAAKDEAEVTPGAPQAKSGARRPGLWTRLFGRGG